METKKSWEVCTIFNCNSLLVPTFKEISPTEFTYERNREIVFDLNDKITKKELQECIKMLLKYHNSIKNTFNQKIKL